MDLENILKVGEPHGDLRSLSLRQQREKAYSLHMSGYTFVDLAEIFHVSASTISKWVKRQREAYSHYLETQSGLDLITNAVYEQDMLRKLAMDEIIAMQNCGVARDIDGNLIRTKDFDHKAYAEYLKIVQAQMEKKTAFLMKIGALPSQPDRIHYSITGDLKVAIDAPEKNEGDNRSEEEIARDIAERLINTRRITSE